MKPPNSAILARLLLAHEAGERRDAEALANAAEQVFDKLRLLLSKLLGPDGFRVLLRRAVTLARSAFPWLEDVPAQSDGFFKGLAAARADGSIADAEALEGMTAVLAYFLGLLDAFIGPDLTLRLLRGVWPQVGVEVDPALDLSGDGSDAEEKTR